MFPPGAARRHRHAAPQAQGQRSLHALHPRCPYADPEPALPSCPPRQGCDLPSTKLDLTESQRATLVSAYDELVREDPTSLAYHRIPLGFLEGQAFANRVDAYMRKHITRYGRSGIT